MLRSAPSQKKALKKFSRNHKKMPEVFPNANVMQDKDGIFLDNNIMNKDYYYKKLVQRLGYARAYKGNLNTTLQEYEAENGELPKKKSRLNLRDADLLAEGINFSKLDKSVETNAKKR